MFSSPSTKENATRAAPLRLRGVGSLELKAQPPLKLVFHFFICGSIVLPQIPLLFSISLRQRSYYDHSYFFFLYLSKYRDVCRWTHEFNGKSTVTSLSSFLGAEPGCLPMAAGVVPVAGTIMPNCLSTCSAIFSSDDLQWRIGCIDPKVMSIGCGPNSCVIVAQGSAVTQDCLHKSIYYP